MGKRLSAGFLAALMVAAGLTTGCASRRLVFNTMSVTPEEVTIGNAILVTVALNDPHEAVATVRASVREVPEMEFELFDDGEEGDKEAGDSVWSCRLIVPPEATPGTYHFDVAAYGPTGTEITVRLSTGEVVPLAASSSVTIVY
jgi:hypothetical protein